MRAAAIALLALAVVWPRARPLRWPLAVAGGVLLVASVWDVSFEGRAVEWAVPSAVAVGVALWWAAPRAHERLPQSTAWLLLLGCAGAVYLCVPETDHLREVAVVVAAGGVAEVLLRRRLPSVALVAATALVEWAALFGATGRPSALAGGLFALTPVVAVAMARRGSWWHAPAVAAVWLVAAGAMARTGGVADSLSTAVVAAAGCVTAAALVTAAVVRLDRR